jgi:hypothetical protein
MPRQLVELDERPGIEQHLDSLTGGLLAAGVLLLDRPRRPGVDGFVGAALRSAIFPAVLWMSMSSSAAVTPRS